MTFNIKGLSSMTIHLMLQSKIQGISRFLLTLENFSFLELTVLEMSLELTFEKFATADKTIYSYNFQY